MKYRYSLYYNKLEEKRSLGKQHKISLFDSKDFPNLQILENTFETANDALMYARGVQETLQALGSKEIYVRL